MQGNGGIKRAIIGGLAGLAALMIVASGHAANINIPWDDTRLFQHRSVDEPLEEVLRQILDKNGFRGIFLQGVKDKEPVTMQFNEMPLEAAFNKIVQENGLSYSYDAQSDTVTVALAAEVQTRFRLITPKNMTVGQIEAALRRFEQEESTLGEVWPVFDAQTGSILLRGSPDQVQELATLINTLDQGAKLRSEAEAEQLQGELEKQRVRMELDSSGILTEVIQLKFANVGETEMTFQGKKVKSPGIDETLFQLLGMDPKSASVAKAGGASGKVSASGSASRISGAISGRLRLSIDKRTNSVIARGTPEAIADVKELIASLDQPVPLVDLEVMIVQADAGTGRTLGVQWAVAQKDSRSRNVFGVSTGLQSGQTVQSLADNQLNANSTTSVIDGSGGGTVTNTQLAIDPISLLPIATFDSIAASFIYNGPRTFVQAQINALSEDNKAQVVSAPHVVTLNNVGAKITSTEKVHVKIATKQGGEGDIKTIDAGLSLDITPSVINGVADTDDELVRLGINAKNASFTSQLTTQEKEIQTQVILRDGATFMLGGLFESRRLETEDGVPGLKDLPLVGGLFRNRQSVDSRAETIFFITPQIVRTEAIVEQGIGVRDFVHSQRKRMGKEREDLKTNSFLLPDLIRLEEEE